MVDARVLLVGTPDFIVCISSTYLPPSPRPISTCARLSLPWCWAVKGWATLLESTKLASLGPGQFASSSAAWVAKSAREIVLSCGGVSAIATPLESTSAVAIAARKVSS